MKKGLTLVIGIVVLAILVGGGYALFHKTNKSYTYSSGSTSSSGSPATTTTNGAVLITKTSSSLGKYFTDPNGQPLYTYGGDSSGVSNCTGSCLTSWPAYQDKGATTGLPTGVGTIKRTDNGATQFTYNGLPLYTFVGDSNGQVTGNGVSNFTVAKPTAATSSTSSNQPSSTAPASSSSSSSNSYNW